MSPDCHVVGTAWSFMPAQHQYLTLPVTEIHLPPQCMWPGGTGSQGAGDHSWNDDSLPGIETCVAPLRPTTGANSQSINLNFPDLPSLPKPRELT